MSCLSANANCVKEDITITATLVREKVIVSAAVVCPIGIDNALHASNGALYDSNYEPIFTTE